MPRISLAFDRHVAHVRLTRPDKRNAVDQDMIDAVIDAAGTIAASDARVVVMSGEGAAFCAGIDLAALQALAGKDPVDLMMPRTHGGGTTNQWQEFTMCWRRLEIPMICALHGAVLGAGLQLALAADIRVAAPDTRMSVMEMQWGIVPDMGGMVLLPRLVRSDVLRRLIYTAEQIGAEQAERWGLVTEIADDPLARAMDLAEVVAGKGPNAIRAAKRLISLAETSTPEAVLLAESRAQAALLGRPEQMEVIAARFQKRDPNFG